ncbi:alpha/beta hydrolase [Chitinophaga solisilvae]|uniref:Alpha/beta hydrolase n=1 Tax=Chitinophaga solisilvae TaxID=1233460 RepID=A0A433WKA3_9BACT|nr:alpha/beta hydrolase [Chitinophaga solisilvae]NSL90889.1 alpha/beta hydrolase [Chitinophaga solisilvae]
METRPSPAIIDAANDPAIERETKAFLQALNSGDGKPMELMTPVEARAVLTGAQKSVQVDISGVDTTEKTISRNGAEIKIVIVKPAGAGGILPVFMFFHGGGWVLGDFPTHQRLIRDLVIYSGAAAVYVDYTPSPEAQYPVAVNQAYAATEWVAENGAEIGVDGSRLAVAGNSVGGNMAAVTALRAHLENGPAIRQQVLLWPVTNADFDTPSYHQYATQRFLTRNMMIWFWDNYLPDKAKRKEIYASPLQATGAQLKGMPPALVQTAENDVLRDEAESYARKMNEAGVPVSLIRCMGMIHDYGLLNPLAAVPEVQSVLRYAGAVLKHALK